MNKSSKLWDDAYEAIVAFELWRRSGDGFDLLVEMMKRLEETCINERVR